MGDSMFAYDYQRDTTAGDNVKMRKALELGLPIILLRKIKDLTFITVGDPAVV
ncbi:hypothetical protein O974_27530 [Mycobacterium avium 11-0986]|nr:hypothetical protein O974_27530 [Mycobacterium avium 11-0986]